MGMTKWLTIEGRDRRHKRIRKNISGTPEKPRLCVYRSLNHMYAQLIDDIKGSTILTVSSNTADFKEKMKAAGNVKAAALVGDLVAERARAKGITKVVFDRGGYKYHGRVKALAEAARKKGLVF